MDQHEQTEAHLKRLAEALAQREFATELVGAGPLHVKVANPDSPRLNERVLCRQAYDGTWCYWWPWQQPIGSVDDLETVAGKIMAVLRTVEGCP